MESKINEVKRIASYFASPCVDNIESYWIGKKKIYEYNILHLFSQEFNSDN